jgi:hypothetical protein
MPSTPPASLPRRFLRYPILVRERRRFADRWASRFVFTIFGLEMLVRLRELGFVTVLYELYAPTRGIVGENAIVFEAVKQPWGWI